ncbi:MAG TPA: hypothetical protein VG738_05670 [Chitinophagaceae bacterium]|nr:hypothetical protein [Chitinophagaceae bacterium]
MPKLYFCPVLLLLLFFVTASSQINPTQPILTGNPTSPPVASYNAFNTGKDNHIIPVVNRKRFFIKKYRAFGEGDPPKKDNSCLNFVGDGNIQKSLAQGQSINANTGVGVVFERYLPDNLLIRNFSIEAQINIATTADTITGKIDTATRALLNRRNFGTYILNPVSAKQAITLNADVNFIKGFSNDIITGANFHAVASNNVWVYGDSACNLGAAYVRLGVYHDFIPEDYRYDKNGLVKYSLVFGNSLTSRIIFGDITLPQSDNFRKNALGNPAKSFVGWEWFVRIRLSNLVAEFDAPVIGTKGASIPGLNNTQFVFSVRFIGGFSIKLNAE